jgi:hypothetical protein
MSLSVCKANKFQLIDKMFKSIQHKRERDEITENCYILFYNIKLKIAGAFEHIEVLRGHTKKTTFTL